MGYVSMGVDNGVQVPAPDNSTSLPAYFDIQSVDYYEYLPCSQGPITVHESDISNLSDFFNVFTASYVTVSGNVSIPSVGALEILASNSITFSAGFTSSGYTVAKIEPSPCSGARMLNPNLHGSPGDSLSANSNKNNSLLNKTDNFRVFPVPASTNITITYMLAQNENVQIVIYNVVGQKVLNVLNTFQKAGKYSLPVQISNLQNGVYICKIVDGSNIVTKQIVVAR